MEFQFDPLTYRYPSRRTVTYGARGMVCAAQPLAAQAGLDIIKQGGNAFDGILAAAACMMLTEPMSCNMLKRQRPGPHAFKHRRLKGRRTHGNAAAWLGRRHRTRRHLRLGRNQPPLRPPSAHRNPETCHLLCQGRLPGGSRGVKALEKCLAEFKDGNAGRAF